MRRVHPVELNAERFAPFGAVHPSPIEPGRDYFDGALSTARPHAKPSLSLVRNAPMLGESLVVRSLERHAHSSQTFVPMNAARWLVVVAPDDSGQPDAAHIRAFVASASQAVTYAPGTWHLGLHVLDRASTHAIFMWRDGTGSDESFANIPPLAIALPYALKDSHHASP